MNSSTCKVKVSVSDSGSESSSSEESINNETMRTKVDLNGDHGSSSDDDSQSDNNDLITNEGWADSIAKILGSNKPKNKKTLVLSRAKKYSETIKIKKEEKHAFEIINEIREEKSKKHQISIKVDSGLQPKKKKYEKTPIRVKPNILEKDRERLLSKIATKGVVQLFNAVRNQQRSLEKTEQSNLSETKKTKIRRKFDKRTFLDSLMGSTKSIIVDELTNSDKSGLKDENMPKWNALRDDFMMGAKMKDWDKDAGDE